MISDQDDWGVGGEEVTEIPEEAPKKRGRKPGHTAAGRKVGKSFGSSPNKKPVQPPPPDWMTDPSKLPKVPPCRR